MVAGKTTNGMASSPVSKGRCERVAVSSAGLGMCGGLRRRALTFRFGAGSEFRIEPRKEPSLSRLTEPEAPRRPKWKADRPR